MLFITLMLIWGFGILPAVHFKPFAEKAYLIASLVLTVIVTPVVWYFRKPGAIKTKVDMLKAFAGLFVLCMAFTLVPLSSFIWFSGGTSSSYFTTYTNASGGKHRCSGIYVYDAELDKEIRICHPARMGNTDKVRVDKISSLLGVAVKGAVIF